MSLRNGSPKPAWQSSLERAYQVGRLPHAWLLSGPWAPALQAAAQAIVDCLLGPGGSAHADYFELRPAGKMRQIGVDDLRALLQELHQTAFCGGAKVALIHEAHRMHRFAANAFLKTLEEPPLGTYVLLLSTDSRALLPTLRSRCVSLRIGDPKPPLDLPVWQAWEQRFKAWIHTLVTAPPRTAAQRAQVLMACYGLMAHFLQIHTQQTKAQWDAQSAALKELPEETLLALEASCSKEVLEGLLDAVALTLRACYQEHPHLSPYCQSLEALQHVQALLTLNFSESCALEAFFLKTLRAWSGVGG